VEIIPPPKRRPLPKRVEQAREHPERHDDEDAHGGPENKVREWIHPCSIRHQRPVPLIELSLVEQDHPKRMNLLAPTR
jgi:hypothetical protein